MDKKQALEEMKAMVEKNTWIKTPYIFTTLTSKNSLIQQRALFEVSAHLQEYIKDFYNFGMDKSKMRPKSLFVEEVLQNGIPPFRIWLKDIGVEPNNYKVVREAINEMNVVVGCPVTDDDNLPTGEVAWMPVFEEFRVRETGDFYKYETANEGDLNDTAISARHYGYIDVTINRRVASRAFDMSAGYINHYKMIARYATKRTTPRLYLLLMRGIGKGKLSVRLTVDEVKNYLGVVPYKDSKGDMVTPYPKFSQFKTKVLDAVKEDLDRMSKLNQTDITFDYELIFPGERKRGEPEYIDFHVRRTTLGTAYNVIVNHAKLDLPTIINEHLQRWKQCLTGIISNITDAVKREHLSKVGIDSYVSGDKPVLTLTVPDKDTAMKIEHMEELFTVVKPHLYHWFGKNVFLKWKVLS